MKSVFSFDSMLTPKLVTGLYWLLLLIAVVSGLATMFGGYGGVTFEKFILGAFTILGGAIGARIWCELMIVIFKINENLQSLKDLKLALRQRVGAGIWKIIKFPTEKRNSTGQDYIMAWIQTEMNLPDETMEKHGASLRSEVVRQIRHNRNGSVPGMWKVYSGT